MSNSPRSRARSSLPHEGCSGCSLRLFETDTHSARWDAVTPAMRAMQVPGAAAVSAA